MNSSQIQTGALLAGGLALALVVYFWPSSDTPQTATPIETTVSQSIDSTPSMQSPRATASVSSSVQVSPSPETPTGSPVTTSASSTPDPTEAAVTGLEVAQNSRGSVTVRWDPIPGVASYVVLSSGSVIATVSDNSALFIWETESLQIGIAAKAPNGTGPVASLSVDRPAGEAAAPPPPVTRPRNPPAPNPPAPKPPSAPLQPATTPPQPAATPPPDAPSEPPVETPEE